MLNTRRSIATEAVTFVATKVTKNAPGRKASLLHRPLPCKSGKTGAAIFLPDYPVASRPCMQKFAMPFHYTRPPLFCLLSPKADLLGKLLPLPQSKIKKRNGLTEKRAGRMACSAEAFFCLDFFWYFFVSRQKRTKPPRL